MDLGYGLFMAEAEGYLNTHTSKMNRLLKDVRDKYYAGVSSLTIDSEYLSQFDLDMEDLTDNDYIRIGQVARTGRL